MSPPRLVLRHLLGWPLLGWALLGWFVIALGAVLGEVPEAIPPTRRESAAITIAVLVLLVPWTAGFLLIRSAVDRGPRSWQVFRAVWLLVVVLAVAGALLVPGA